MKLFEKNHAYEYVSHAPASIFFEAIVPVCFTALLTFIASIDTHGKT